MCADLQGVDLDLTRSDLAELARSTKEVKTRLSANGDADWACFDLDSFRVRVGMFGARSRGASWCACINGELFVIAGACRLITSGSFDDVIPRMCTCHAVSDWLTS